MLREDRGQKMERIFRAAETREREKKSRETIERQTLKRNKPDVKRNK